MAIRASKHQILLSMFLLAGCARLFGWEIHAPALLSENYYRQADAAARERIALYLPDEATRFISKNRGGKLADPQTYFVGEAFTPMAIEAFQHGFSEFIYMEAEPTPELMRRYGISYLAAVRIKEFGNLVTLKGQSVALRTEILVFDPALEMAGRFEAEGSSGAEKVFAKKGGPEVNLNAAVENNVRATVQSFRDWLRSRRV